MSEKKRKTYGMRFNKAELIFMLIGVNSELERQCVLRERIPNLSEGDRKKLDSQIGVYAAICTKLIRKIESSGIANLTKAMSPDEKAEIRAEIDEAVEAMGVGGFWEDA